MHKHDIMILMAKLTDFLRDFLGKIWHKKSDEELGAISRGEYSTYDNSSDDPRRVTPYRSSHLAREINRSASIDNRKEDEDEDEEEESVYGRNRKHYGGMNEHLHYAMEQNRIPIHSNRQPEADYSKRNPKQYGGINDHKKYIEELRKPAPSPVSRSDPAALREKARKKVERMHAGPKTEHISVSQQLVDSFKDIEK